MTFTGDRVARARALLDHHAQSESHLRTRAPDAVAYPTSTEDVSRIAALAEAVEETRADLTASILTGPIVGRAGDGNFYAILLVRLDDPREIAVAKRLAARMPERALCMGDTITAKHRNGMGKLGYIAAKLGEAWGVMGAMKRALEPKRPMKAGKLVPLE